MIHLPGSPTRQVSEWLSRFAPPWIGGMGPPPRRCLATMLLARPRRLHLEHQDPGGQRRRSSAMLARDAADVQPALAHRGRGHRGRRRDGGWFTFETAVGARQRPCAAERRRCWTLLTTMKELKGFEEKRGPTRGRGVEHGVVRDRKTWLERTRRRKPSARLHDAALLRDHRRRTGRHRARRAAEAARMCRRIIIEKNARPGDSWRKRYKSLCLHDPVWYDHLPYLPFPDHWPVFTPEGQDRRLAGDVRQGHGAELLGLDRVPSAPLRRGRRRNGRSTSSATARRSCCGPGSWCLRPACRHAEHAANPGARRLSRATNTIPASSAARSLPRARKCVVLGSNNSAHDICAALWEHGADVTMIQRSSTTSSSSETLMELALGDLYSERARRRPASPPTRPICSSPRMPYRFMAAPADAALRRDRASAMPTSTQRLDEGRVPARLRRRRLGPGHEGPAARLGLLHRRRRLGVDRRRRDQAAQRRQRRGDPADGFRRADRRQRACPPT